MAKSLPWSKWSKHQVLSASAEVKAHLPHTRWMNRERFAAMTQRYGDLIAKPSARSGGMGVVRIRKLSDGRYRVQAGRSKSTLSEARLYPYVRRQVGRYGLVQQRISLASIQGRPYDLRVMVQRRRGGDWVVTGRLAKVAGSGYIITNTARTGGRILSLERALNRTEWEGEAPGPEQIAAEVDRVALLAAKQLRTRYRYLRTVGLDLGVDRQGKVWIIEANFAPSLSLFRRLGNRTMLRKIRSYQQA